MPARDATNTVQLRGRCVEFAVSTERVTGGWLVTVAGEVDLDTAPRLRAVLDEAVSSAAASGSHPSVLVDLARVSFMDSTGLGELMAAHKALTVRSGRLVLVVASERVARLLSLTGLSDVLEVHPDRATGLAALDPT